MDTKQQIERILSRAGNPKKWLGIGVVIGLLTGSLGAYGGIYLYYTYDVRNALQQADTRPQIEGFDLYEPASYQPPEIPPPFEL